MNKWAEYLLWIIGMIILLGIVGHVENAVQRAETATFHVVLGGWIDTVAVFILGIYLSLLFIHVPRKINVPFLVCVFVPTTIFSLYLPVAVAAGMPIPDWTLPFLKLQLFPIFSGLSLMLSIFGRNE